jgi:hypothetical protein
MLSGQQIHFLARLSPLLKKFNSDKDRNADARKTYVQVDIVSYDFEMHRLNLLSDCAFGTPLCAYRQ